MSTHLERLLSQALELPEADRARLALCLIESLEEETDDEAQVERALEDEIRRRLDEHGSGRTRRIPASEVLSEARRSPS